MRNWYIRTENPQHIGILLYPKFSNHCLANALEPLRAANTLSGRKLYTWQFLTVDGQPVRSSSELPIVPEERLSRSLNGDFLFVLPSYDFEAHDTANNAKALQAAARRFGVVVGMDTGSWLLASAGLLDQRKATIHWDEINRFAEAFPDVDTVEDRFVVDRNRITCGGAMTTFDLVLELIGRTHGQSLGLEVSALFMAGIAGRPQEPQVRRSGSTIVDNAVAVMSSALEVPVSLPDLARQCGTTQRALQQQFRTHLGATPQQVYVSLRLTAARRMFVQTDHSVAEVALRCGYENASSMTRAFVAQFGMTPRRVRRSALPAG